ncbi:hypothetical protein [Erwinia sp. 198]|uniref:hypothetical protein n=1 Tax=Erwinia sp. 198 TaxID=2022746 RepID=UPI000F674F93|nr:hypothetical protein [Erwinia sp. 198]RRZ95800.1 hypothetical protein EGK14_04405 [Erwinia sp. 198]
MNNQEVINEMIKRNSDRYIKHLTDDLDDVSLVLKSHLFIEELLHDIILFHCKNSRPIEGIQLSFNHKLKLAEAMFGSHIPDANFPENIWPVLDALNKLRNVIAHEIDSPKLDDKLNNFLRMSEGLVGKKDVDVFTKGYLSEAEKKSKRLMISLWKILGYLGCMHAIAFLNSPSK